MEKYIVYISFKIEAENIEIAEKMAKDIAYDFRETQEKSLEDFEVTVRGTSSN